MSTTQSGSSLLHWYLYHCHCRVVEWTENFCDCRRSILVPASFGTPSKFCKNFPGAEAKPTSVLKNPTIFQNQITSSTSEYHYDVKKVLDSSWCDVQVIFTASDTAGCLSSLNLIQCSLFKNCSYRWLFEVGTDGLKNSKAVKVMMRDSQGMRLPEQ